MNKWVRRAGIGVGGIVGLMVVLVGAVYGLSSMKINKRFTVTPPALVIPADSATINRGRHLATAISKCVDCHGDDFGGLVFIDDAALARLAGSNLTRSATGLGSLLTDTDWVRAIRHGVGRDGRGLPFMPSEVYQFLGDADLAAIIAYVKSVPPVDRTLPSIRYGLLGRALLVAGVLPLFPADSVDHNRPLQPPPPTGVTVEYGGYQANIGGCTGCHGPGLSGGPMPGGPPDWPPPRNLTPEGLGSWSEADFFRAMREGKRPDGLDINPAMPVRLTKLMTDTEIKAVWAYLKTVPPKPYGGR